MRISKLQRALVAVALVSSTISLSGLATDAQAKTRKPTVQEIAAAKAAEQAKAQAAAAAKAKLDKASAKLKVLAKQAAAARARLMAEQKLLDAATNKATIAATRAAMAQAQVDATKKLIGNIAAGAYKMGGGFTSLDSLLKIGRAHV